MSSDLLILIAFVWFVLFVTVMLSLGKRLTELAGELRRMNISLEKLAARVHEDSVARTDIRGPIGSSEIEDALK